jgi:hypothetical protein
MMTKVIDTLHLCSVPRRPCWAEVALLKSLAVARLRRLSVHRRSPLTIYSTVNL